MSDSFKRFQQGFETFSNKQAAEIEAVRGAFQDFVARILSAVRKGEGENRSNHAPSNRRRLEN